MAAGGILGVVQDHVAEHGVGFTWSKRQGGRVAPPRLEAPARESRRHLREHAVGDVDADHVRAGVERELGEKLRAGSHIRHDHAG